jgi:iron-sulfur cluster assembly protein
MRRQINIIVDNVCKLCNALYPSGCVARYWQHRVTGWVEHLDSRREKMESTVTQNTIQFAVTERAIEEIKKFMIEQDVPATAGLRIRVVPGGCSGFQYSMNIEETADPDDEMIETDGIKVFIDPLSKRFLSGVRLDYVTSIMGSGFTFENPNATGGCGCGSSFSV